MNNITALDIINRVRFAEDRVFIKKMLKAYPHQYHLSIMQGYVEAFKQGMKGEPKDIKKKGAGRRTANLSLLNKDVKIDWTL